MYFNTVFILNALLLGVGLAMDAFSVSLANGLNEPLMKKDKMLVTSGVFALFQTVMPLIGWFCVRTAAREFTSFQRFIPWIALVLLLFIGGKMLIEGIGKSEKEEKSASGAAAIVIQGIATSIDALSVGFTISEYNAVQAAVESMIIGMVTFAVCFAGVILGKKFGTKLAGKASVLGGAILIAIGIEIFISGITK